MARGLMGLSVGHATSIGFVEHICVGQVTTVAKLGDLQV